jgi:hypothetical protein
MPPRTDLTYDCNDPGPLAHFVHPLLTKLEVKCGQWSVWRGNLQLRALYIGAANAWWLRVLDLNIQCSEHLLMEVLRLVPNLPD